MRHRFCICGFVLKKKKTIWNFCFLGLFFLFGTASRHFWSALNILKNSKNGIFLVTRHFLRLWFRFWIFFFRVFLFCWHCQPPCLVGTASRHVCSALPAAIFGPAMLSPMFQHAWGRSNCWNWNCHPRLMRSRVMEKKKQNMVSDLSSDHCLTYMSNI